MKPRKVLGNLEFGIPWRDLDKMKNGMKPTKILWSLELAVAWRDLEKLRIRDLEGKCRGRGMKESSFRE